MDRFIELIQKSQRADGYLHTPVIIAEMNKQATAKEEAKENATIGTKVGTGKDGAFGNRLNFETYNLGHLITAGIMHKRATGKTTLFNCAVKAADFLYDFYKRASDELARNAICPSHYMAIAEMYRETGNPKYLELSEKLIDIRGRWRMEQMTIKTVFLSVSSIRLWAIPCVPTTYMLELPTFILKVEKNS